MPRFLRNTLITVLGLVPIIVFAQEFQVSNAWVRKNLPGQNDAALFMTVTAASPGSLVAAQADVSEFIELRQVRSVSGGRVENVLVREIPLEAKQVNLLRASGFHLLLRNLKTQSLQSGDTIPFRLKIQTGSGQLVDLSSSATVRGLSGQ